MRSLDYELAVEQANALFYAVQGCELRPQPTGTLTNEGYTDSRFSVGSKRMFSDKAEHNSRDRVHMNDEFGEMWIRDLIEYTACER